MKVSCQRRCDEDGGFSTLVAWDHFYSSSNTRLEAVRGVFMGVGRSYIKVVHMCYILARLYSDLRVSLVLE